MSQAAQPCQIRCHTAFNVHVTNADAFRPFEIDPAERVLRIDGQNAVVGARAFDLLLALAERCGQLVSKQELLDIVWPGVVVEEHNIAAQMSTLRKLLGPDVIATIAVRGYRFAAAPGDAPLRSDAPPRHNLPDRARASWSRGGTGNLARVVPQSRLTTLIASVEWQDAAALQFARDQIDAFEGGFVRRLGAAAIGAARCRRLRRNAGTERTIRAGARRSHRSASDRP